MCVIWIYASMGIRGFSSSCAVSAEIEIRKMAENLGRNPESSIESDAEFIDIGGIRLRKNTL